MIKKVMILVCVLTIGVVFATENNKTEPVNETELSQLNVLLTPTAITKVILPKVVSNSTVCESANGSSSVSYNFKTETFTVTENGQSSSVPSGIAGSMCEGLVANGGCWGEGWGIE